MSFEEASADGAAARYSERTGRRSLGTGVNVDLESDLEGPDNFEEKGDWRDSDGVCVRKRWPEFLRVFVQFTSRSKHDLVGSLRGAPKKSTVGGLLRGAKDDGGGG